MALHTLSPSHMCTQGEPQPLFFSFFFAQEGIFMLTMILNTDQTLPMASVPNQTLCTY